MPFEPSNVCARTAAGDAELARPSRGLALAQRKLLSALDAPLILDELATRYGVENARLIRDLERLAALGLVVVHGAGRSTSGSAARRTPAPVPRPRVEPSALRTPAPTARIGTSRRPNKSRRVLLLLLVALVMAAGIVLLGRSGAMPTVLGDAFSPSPPVPMIAEPSTAPAPAVAAVPPIPVSASVAADAARLPAGEIPASLSASPSATQPPSGTPLTVPNAAPAGLPVPVQAPAATPDTAPGPALPASNPSFVAVAPAAPVEATRPVTAQGPAPGLAPVPATAPVAATTSAPERPAPPVTLAAASPASLPIDRPAARPLIPLTQEAPPFPREAINTGTKEGTVRARLTIDAAGRVTNVAIVDAQPRRVFDRAVTTALAYWTYEAGAAGRTTEVEVAFRRD